MPSKIFVNTQATKTEADDIGPAVPVHIRQLALVKVIAAPTAGAWREGGEFKRGRCKVPVAGGQ